MDPGLKVGRAYVRDQVSHALPSSHKRRRQYRIKCYNSHQKLGFMVNKEQLRAARAWLNLSQQELADVSLVTKGTIARFELGQSLPHERTLRDLRAALEQQGIEFLFEGQKGVGIRLKTK